MGALLAFLVVSLLFVPVALVLWGDNRLASRYARALGRSTTALLGVKVAVRNGERLGVHPSVFVGNHQSNLDALVIGTTYPERTAVIGKRSVALIPLFGLLFLATRNILINRHDKRKAIAGIDKAVAVLKDRRDSIWIFPEGTRNRTGEPLAPFKKGAFHMAIAGGVPVVPVVVGPVKHFIDLDAKRVRRGTIEVSVLEPVPTTGLGSADVEALRDRVRELMRAEVELLFRRAGVPFTEGAGGATTR